MFELGRERPVARHRGPTVGQHLHVRAPEVHHGLDREEHAGPEHDAFAAPAVMQDIGFVVEQAAHAVPAELAHDRAALALGVILDRRPDVARRRARPDLPDTDHQRLVGHLDQPLGAPRELAHAIHS